MTQVQLRLCGVGRRCLSFSPAVRQGWGEEMGGLRHQNRCLGRELEVVGLISPRSPDSRSTCLCWRGLACLSALASEPHIVRISRLPHSHHLAINPPSLYTTLDHNTPDTPTMATSPIITFKAGKCTPTPSAPGKSSIKPDPTPGYLYLYSEDDLLHFCWRPRSAPSTDPELDLLMIPGDGSFQPLVKNPGAETVESPTTGRIFVLRFQSSSQKHFFWMQSKTQASGGKLNEFGERDQRLGQIVDLLLQGEDVNVQEEIEEIRRGGGGDDGGPNGDADAMEVDDQGHGLSRQGSGGAGADATGGDARDEGEASREGGADGGRA